MPASLPELAQGVVPPGRYADGSRSPIVHVRLCAVCAGYPPMTGADYEGALSGRCGGCGARSRELHRFPAYIHTVGGCTVEGCADRHPRVHGDMDHRTWRVAGRETSL